MPSVFQAVIAVENEGVTFSLEALSSRLDQRAQKIITELSFADLGIPEDGALQQALHCLEALEKTATKVTIRDLELRISQLEREGNMEEAMRLVDEVNRFKRAS
jgi:hypothetical protein